MLSSRVPAAAPRDFRSGRERVTIHALCVGQLRGASLTWAAIPTEAGRHPGPAPPSRVYAYIEITPYDFIKYEVDKTTGYLLVDRPQRTSSQPPTLYGFIPRTYCGQRVAALCPKTDEGDGDHLSPWTVSERCVGRPVRPFFGGPAEDSGPMAVQ